jgi:hypothetical protein
MHWEDDSDSDGDVGSRRDSREELTEDDEDISDAEDLEAFIDDAEQDQLEGPDWAFDKEETIVAPRKGQRLYLFCGAPHRKQILKIHTTHICQHPFFYERRETVKWTSEQIRANAVQELYLFCERRGLREVWGYLWANWYSPQRWKLWARSSSPEFLSRLRTTMGTENFWRQLKHIHLKNIPRPRLDHLVYILINVVTPEYYSRLAKRSKAWGEGTSKELSPFQMYFKKSWKKVEQRTVGKTVYVVDLETWLCNCGYQKFHPYHLCKHLIKAVGPIPKLSRFWQEIRRRRKLPLYVHPLIQKTGLPERGSITDGDDTDDENVESIFGDLRPSKRRRIGPVVAADGGDAPRVQEGTDEPPMSDVDIEPRGSNDSPMNPSSSCPGSDIDLDEVSH